MTAHSHVSSTLSSAIVHPLIMSLLDVADKPPYKKIKMNTTVLHRIIGAMIITTSDLCSNAPGGSLSKQLYVTKSLNIGSYSLTISRPETCTTMPIAPHRAKLK